MILDSINSIYLKNLMQSTMADGLVVLHYQLWILCIKRTIVCKQYTLVPVIGISQVGIILSYTTYLKIGQILLLNEISPRGSCLSNTGKKILRFSLHTRNDSTFVWRTRLRIYIELWGLINKFYQFLFILQKETLEKYR